MTRGPVTAYLEAKPNAPYDFVLRGGKQRVQTYQDRGFVGFQGTQGGNVPIIGFLNAVKNPFPPIGGTLNPAWSATNGTVAVDDRGIPAAGGDYVPFDPAIPQVFNNDTPNCVKLLATGANAELKQSTSYPGGAAFRVRALWAVHNRAAASRTFQPTIDGTNSGSAVTIPAGQLWFVRSGSSSFGVPQKVLGLKVTNSANGERFDVWDLSAPAGAGLLYAGTPAVIKERNADGVAESLVGPGFTGTAYDSPYQQGPSFWMIPLTADIFDATSGEIAVDIAALWPVGGVTYHPLFNIGSKSLFEAGSANWHKDAMYAWLDPGGASAITFRQRSSSGMAQESTNANPAIPIGDSKSRHTYFVSWESSRWGAAVDTAAQVYNRRSNVDAAWPFNAALVPDPVLSVGARPDYPNGGMATVQFFRIALCDRSLTPEERAYLSDPTSVYAVNALAVPYGAGLSGSMDNWIRGDTQHIGIEIIDADGFPVALYGTTIWLTIKPVDTDLNTDSDATLKAYITISNTGAVTGSNLLELIDADTGRIRLSIGTTEAGLFMADQTYKWDIQGRSVSGDIRTCRQGQLTIQPEVTRRITTP